MIHAGRVAVNGRVTENPDQWVTLGRDRVTLDGRPLAAEKRLYLLLYKPPGYLTTRADPEGRPTVYDLIRDDPGLPWVSPVGRLDLDTSGLLILTNDTQLGERLTNPRYKVPKTYLAKTATLVDEGALETLRGGVELSDGVTETAEVRRLRDSARRSWLEITITEGRNRQVRRMIEAIGSRVLKLVRTRIGGIGIGDLAIGRYRHLSAAEVARLLG